MAPPPPPHNGESPSPTMHPEREASLVRQPQSNRPSPSPTNGSRKRPSENPNPLSPTVKRRVLSKTLEVTAMSAPQAQTVARDQWMRNLSDTHVKVAYAIVNLAVQAQSPDHIATAEMIEEFLEHVYVGWIGESFTPTPGIFGDFHNLCESCTRSAFVGVSDTGVRVDFVCTITTKTGQVSLHYADALNPLVEISDLSGICWKDSKSLDAIKRNVIKQAADAVVRSARDYNTAVALWFARVEIRMPPTDQDGSGGADNSNGSARRFSKISEEVLAGRSLSGLIRLVKAHQILRALPPGTQLDQSVFPPRMVEEGTKAKLPQSGRGGSGNGFNVRGTAAGAPQPA